MKQYVLAAMTLVILLENDLAGAVTWDGSGDMNWTQPDSTSWSSSTYNSGDDVQFLVTGAGTVNIQAGGVTPGLITVNSASDFVFSGGSISGTGSLTKSGGGSLTLVTANSFSGGTTLSAGQISVNSDNGLGSGTLTVTGNSTLGPAYGVYPVIPNNVEVNSGVTLTGPTSTQYFSLGINGVVSGGGTIVIGNNNNGNSGYKLGLFNSANTFTGTIIGSGTQDNILRVNSLGDGPNPLKLSYIILELNSGTVTPLLFNSRYIEMNGAAGVTIRNSNGSAANTITINTDLKVTAAGNKTLTLDGSNSGSNTFGGAITNRAGAVISVTKSGSGKWILTGTNSYSGATTINSGTLEIAGAGVLGGDGTYAGDITNSGTFRCNSSATQTWSGVISGPSALAKGGSGRLILSGHNTYTNITRVSGGDFMGVTGGSCSNSAVTVTNTPGVVSAAGVIVTNSTMQWTCESLTFKTNGVGSQLKFNFAVEPTTNKNMAPLNITGNLTFSGGPVVVVESTSLTPGTYPLLAVGGTAPLELPGLSLTELKLLGLQGTLSWDGTGKILLLKVSATGTVISVR